MNRGVGALLALVDAACVVLGLFCAWAFWLWYAPNLQDLVQIPFWSLWLPNDFMPAGLVMLAVWGVALNQLGMHDPGRMNNSATIARSVTRAAVFATIFLVVENFLVGDRLYPKGLVFPFLVGTGLIVLVVRLSLFRVLLRFEKPPTAVNAVIVGVEEDGFEMAERMEREARHVAHVVGHVLTESETTPLVPAHKILGTIPELQAIVNKHDIRMVVVATRVLPRKEAMRMAVQADHMGLRVLQAPLSWGVVSPRLGFARVGDLDLIDLVGLRYPTLAEQMKRAFDLVAVLAGGAIIVWPLLVVAAIIKLQDGGPILYSSERLGRGGRKFGFLKFRSMVVDADKKREELAHLNEADGRLFKMSNDPRVTPFGRFIRKYSIDEFPQLINVLRGEMNLVGPRPLPVQDLHGIDEDTEMAYWFEQRSKVNPGLTGLWQVSGRSDLGFADMVRLDIRYIQDWTLWLDLQILLKTIPAVLKGRGAR